VTEDMNWKDLLKYFVHGMAFSTLFFVLAIAWTFVLAFLVGVGAIIGFIIGFVLLFLMIGFLNSVITSYLWFKVKFGFWDFLFHGIVLFVTLLMLNVITTVPTLVLPGIATTVITYIIATFLEGFVAKKLAGWWQAEYATRVTLKSLLSSAMFRYIVRRLLYMIPVFLGISIISFFVMYAAGDPLNIIRLGRPTVTQETIDALKVYYGLDKPIPIQYLNWLANILQFNFGKSLYGGRSVNFLIGSWVWETANRTHINNNIFFSARMATFSGLTWSTISLVGQSDLGPNSASNNARSCSCLRHVSSKHSLNPSKHARNLEIRLYSRS